MLSSQSVSRLLATEDSIPISMGQELGKLKVIEEAAETSFEVTDIPASDNERERALFARADELGNAAVSRKNSASLSSKPD